MQWCESAVRRQWLEGFGVQVEYIPDLSLSALQPGWETHNIGREGPAIDEDAVESMAESDAAGAMWEPTIVCKCPDGYALLDGKQRAKTAEFTDCTVVAAYIVKGASPRILAEIARGANAINGHRPSPTARIQSAMELMSGHGLSAKEAAIRMGLTKKQLDAAIKRQCVKDILISNDREPEGHINGLLDELTRLTDKPKILVAAYDKAKEMRLDSPMQREFAREVEKAAESSIKEAHDVFDSWKQRPEVLARMMRDECRKVGDIDNLLRLLHSVEGILKRKFDKIKRVDKKTRDEYERLAKFIHGKLLAAACEHKKALASV